MDRERVAWLLAADFGSLTEDQRAVRTLVTLDMSLHGEQSFEGYYRSGGTPDAILAALGRVGALRALSALRPLVATHGEAEALANALAVDDEATLLRLREGLDVYEAVADEIGRAATRKLG